MNELRQFGDKYRDAAPDAATGCAAEYHLSLLSQNDSNSHPASARMSSLRSKKFQRILSKQGVTLMLNTEITEAEKQDGKVYLKTEGARGGQESTVDTDVVLVAIGRVPTTSSLGLNKIGDESIKCIGDVTFGPMLAHNAEEEGIAAEYIKTGHGHMNYHAIPSIVYINLEVACLGKQEQELREAGVKYKTGMFPVQENSRAKTNLDTEGTVKFITDAEIDCILGVHIIGLNAGEMIAEATLALEYDASSEDVARKFHAHRTLSEMAVSSRPSHFG
ncbi:hypothetical protein FOMPIDRAFT_1052736 [Fomitopsis schrenkii]|uniref:Dihydrolipoyl dehydrogenase n=1 Tax=Fomitopsis schrenkii TaxID=2126942 RepID=S8F5P7_FOMSC|nr:hypothetical protein FOMPIDRAFT_1052736 [Fomitopsis schrenkii]